jgi:hypothetical protein
VVLPRVKKGNLEPNVKENYFHGGEEKWMTILAKRKQKSLTLSCLSVICVEKIIFSRKRILGKILLQLPQRLASEDLWSGYGDCPSDGVYGVVVCIAC